MTVQVQPPVHTETVDLLKVQVYADRRSMGLAAARDVAGLMKQLLREKSEVRMIFAAAPSQNEFLEGLSEAEGIDWSRVVAFHMDEYIGLPEDAPQRFGHFLRDRLFDLVVPGKVHLIDSANAVDEECGRYGRLIAEKEIDIVCLGIGENGHIAFNDPPVADFQDPEIVKPVDLDDICRQQQVNDGCFPSLADVPTHALTLTIPALMSGAHLFCIVPGPAKASAVNKTLRGPITPECPASVLRRHPKCTLYLDTFAFGDSE